MFVASWLEILIVVAIILFIWMAISRSRRGLKRSVSPHRPQPRHRITRIVCGTLGVLLLVAVGFGTWAATRDCYPEPTDIRSVTTRVPTEEAPSDDSAEGRFLVHILITTSEHTGFLPVHVDEFVVNWPEDIDKEFKGSFEVLDMEIKYSMQDLRPLPNMAEIAGGVPFWAQKSLYFQWERHNIHAVRFCSLNRDYLGHFEWGVRSNPVFSIVPSPYPHVLGFQLITRLAEDDPLQDISAREFVDARQEKLAASIQESETPKRPPIHPIVAGLSGAGFTLAGQIGLAAVILLIAALCLTQVFSNRPMAFVLILFAVILYTAALDRMALGYHLSNMRDTNLPVETRIFACDMTRHSFFYKQTAFDEVNLLAESGKTPQQL